MVDSMSTCYYNGTMNSSHIELQLGLAHDALSEASGQQRIDLAKFALGLIAGVAGAVVAEGDRHTVLRIAMDGSRETTVDQVISAAVALKTMAENSI